ncbi:hypothetical protein TRVL_09459 [Trypanosoma vivax]|nr:hypothetical protein TRVL_09459 [Trypanosoma vivax]
MLDLDIRRASVLLWRRVSSAGETTRNVGAHFAFTSPCACDVARMRLNCDKEKYVCVVDIVCKAKWCFESGMSSRCGRLASQHAMLPRMLPTCCVMMRNCVTEIQNLTLR